VKQKALLVKGIKLDVLLVKVPEGPPSPSMPRPWTAFCLTPVPTTTRVCLGHYFGKIEYAYGTKLEHVPPLSGVSEGQVLDLLRQHISTMLADFEEVKTVGLAISPEEIQESREKKQAMPSLSSSE